MQLPLKDFILFFRIYSCMNVREGKMNRLLQYDIIPGHISMKKTHSYHKLYFLYEYKPIFIKS